MKQFFENLFKKEKNEQTPQITEKTQKQPESNIQVIHFLQKWRLEFLIQYLQSPIWISEINNFIDQNCIIFEDSQENYHEYMNVFNKFNDFLDNTLTNFVEQTLKMRQEDFQKLIQAAMQIKEYYGVLRQLLMADDFDSFKDLMIKRNKQIEQQALQQLNGIIENEIEINQINQDIYFKDKDLEQLNDSDDDEETIQLKKAIQQSLEQSLAQKQIYENQIQNENFELEQAIKLSQIEYQQMIQENKQMEQENEDFILDKNQQNDHIHQNEQELNEQAIQIDKINQKEEENFQQQQVYDGYQIQEVQVVDFKQQQVVDENQKEEFQVDDFKQQQVVDENFQQQQQEEEYDLKQENFIQQQQQIESQNLQQNIQNEQQIKIKQKIIKKQYIQEIQNVQQIDQEQQQKLQEQEKQKLEQLQQIQKQQLKPISGLPSIHKKKEYEINELLQDRGNLKDQLEKVQEEFQNEQSQNQQESIEDRKKRNMLLKQKQDQRIEIVNDYKQQIEQIPLKKLTPEQLQILEKKKLMMQKIKQDLNQ